MPGPDRLGWYLRRLRSMPAAELPHRVREQARRSGGRRVAAVPAAGRRRETGLADVVLTWAGEPSVRSWWQQRAGDLHAGHVTVFGVRWPVRADGVPDWRLDPCTGHRWPDGYCFDVPTTGPSGAEVKLVWELNRLGFLLPAAAHAAAADDGVTRAAVVRVVRRWVADNPPRRGVVWRSGIELAIRVLAMVVLAELVAAGGAAAELDDAVGRSVAEHVDWIRRFPSRFSSANNHRVAELTGLLVGAAAFPALAGAADVARWWAELEEHVCRQVLADGGPAEQSTGYAALVLEWAAVCAVIGPRLGRTLGAETTRRVQAGAGFLAALTDTGGHAVRIGDDDESRLLTAARPEADPVPAVVGLVEQVLGRSVPPPAQGVQTFPVGGYTVLRAGRAESEALWVIDHGPLGFGHLAAHAHADTLAVWLHAGGRPVLVDAGTFLYQSAGDWRDRLRGTAAHNTVLVAGHDASEPSGPFNWHPRRRAGGRLVRLVCRDGGALVEAEHDGYRRRSGVVHRRSLAVAGPGTFELTDRLVGGRRECTWSMLVAPDLSVTDTDTGWLVCDRDRPVLRICTDSPGRRERRRGDDDGLGWCSPRFGRIEPADRLLIHSDLGRGAELRVRFAVCRTPDERPLLAKGAW